MAEIAVITCAVMSLIAGGTSVMDLIHCDEFIAQGATAVLWALLPRRTPAHAPHPSYLWFITAAHVCLCHHCCCMCWCVVGSFNRFLSVFSRFLRSKLSKKFCCCDGALHKSLRPKSFAKFGWISPK